MVLDHSGPITTGRHGSSSMVARAGEKLKDYILSHSEEIDRSGFDGLKLSKPSPSRALPAARLQLPNWGAYVQTPETVVWTFNTQTITKTKDKGYA